jgi:hypothetical protein
MDMCQVISRLRGRGRRNKPNKRLHSRDPEWFSEPVHLGKRSRVDIERSFDNCSNNHHNEGKLK